MFNTMQGVLADLAISGVAHASRTKMEDKPQYPKMAFKTSPGVARPLVMSIPKEPAQTPGKTPKVHSLSEH